MDDQWYDEAAGPLVRPYAITGGRTPSETIQLDVATQVLTVQGEHEQVGLGPEHIAIIDMCQRPLSIAELSAYINVPLGVVRVLCGDLADRGDVIIRSPSRRVQDQPNRELLQGVLDGLCKL